MNPRAVALAVCLSLLFALVPVSPASAQLLTYDIPNWLQAIAAYYQRYEQLRIKYNQLRALQKQLESFGEAGDWNSLNGTLGQLDQIFAMGENLGYLLAGVETIFDETFPGYTPPISWPEEYSLRVRRGRNTLQMITASLNRLTCPTPGAR